MGRRAGSPTLFIHMGATTWPDREGSDEDVPDVSDADETALRATPTPGAGAEAACGADRGQVPQPDRSVAAVRPPAAEFEALVASALRDIAERALAAAVAARMPAPVDATNIAEPREAVSPVMDERRDERRDDQREDDHRNDLADGAPAAPEPAVPDEHIGDPHVDAPSAAQRAPDTAAPALFEPTAPMLTDPAPPEPAPASDAAAPPPDAWPGDTEPAAAAAPTGWASRLTWRGAARLAGLAVAGYFALIFALILLYRFVNPPTTTLIAYQWLAGTRIEQSWVPIEDISPNLLRAVVVSEDWGFCDHYGVDLVAIEQALEQAGEGSVPRGASTISMQVIKNLFLSQSKSYLRKAVEIPLTFVAEAVWPKSRMLEIYLNIAEWGPGVFGAEAAARHHFSKPAARLSEREAALLAAALPNPILRDAGDPGTRTARKASVIQSRMRAAGPVADCAMAPRKPENRGSGWQTTVKKRAGTAPGL